MRYQDRANSHQRERKLRSAATRAEKRLWFGLRTLKSFKFRRQHRINRFIVDFYCASVKLAVEVDGSAHNGEDAEQRDWERDEQLRALGIRILRVRNEHVIDRLGEVVRKIEETCAFL
jgi:very-short-patch-repair endonuclease